MQLYCMFMAGSVKGSAPVAPDLRALRVARTEAQLIEAATELFLAQGYTATTLADVARRARLAPRTVYLRFGSKANLFSRVVDRALAGDGESLDLRNRPGTRQAMSAPTLAQRIDAFAQMCVGLADRAGALFEVAAQAEGVEPDLAAAFQAGRSETQHLCARFWDHARADGLLDDRIDVGTLVVVTDLLVCADTTVHLRRTRGWKGAEHQSLIKDTLATLTRSPE